MILTHAYDAKRILNGSIIKPAMISNSGVRLHRYSFRVVEIKINRSQIPAWFKLQDLLLFQKFGCSLFTFTAQHSVDKFSNEQQILGLTR